MAAALLVALSALLAGCGGDAAGPVQFAVVRRDFAWTAVPDPAAGPRPPLGVDWDGAASRAPPGSRLLPWRAPDGSPAVERLVGERGERLLLSGTGRVELDGPEGVPVDPQLQHWLVLRLAAGGAHTLVVQWRRHDQAWADDRASQPMPIPPAQGFQTLSFAVAGLRGIREASDAEQGVDEFRFRFEGDEGAAVRVEIERIALVSDYDAAADGAWNGRLARSGFLRHGLALRVPGAATAEIPCADGERLRFALATAGLDAPAIVTVDDRDGRLPPTRFEVAPDGAWTEQALPIPQAPAGRPLGLRVRVESPAATRPGVLLVGSVMTLAPTRAPRPPVVLYVEDTLRADHLGAYGWPHPADPRLASIAREGAVFERVWTTASWTRPAMSSLLTSLDPIAHGNRTHLDRVPEGIGTLAQALSDGGYVTASFVTNYHAGAWAGLDRGFDPHGDPIAFGATEIVSTLTSTAIREPIDRFLREHADERLFVFAHSLDPHMPYRPPSDCVLELLQDPTPRVAPEEVADRQRWERDTVDYDGEILHNDRELGALDDTLGALGLRARTLFVFASDHGEAFGEHGQFGHKKSLHEEEVRVPWILRWPERIAPGTRLPAPASLLDVAPTILGLCGLAAPAGWQGRDLSSQLPAAAPTGGATAVGASGQAPVADARARPFLLDVVYPDDAPRGTEELAAVLWPWKLLVARDAGDALRPLALYDLSTDPRERRNLLGDGGRPADLPPELAARVDGLLRFLAERLAAGPLVSGAAAAAGAMDPAMEQWMRQMGYLR